MAQKYSDNIGSRHLKLINFIRQYLEEYIFLNLIHKKRRKGVTKPGS